MKKFRDLSYLGQVRRLRGQAVQALKSYSFSQYQLEFINHGENATFKVKSGGQVYLLRLHRNDYHEKKAILEELKWLKKLAKNPQVNVQEPVLTRSKQLVVNAEFEGVPERYCDVLTWQNGKIKYASLTSTDYTKVGELTANLHLSSKKIQANNRLYWGAQGLLGKDAKFGSLLNFKNRLSTKNYEVLNQTRKVLLKKISQYEKKYSDKAGLIHADLHFGNIIWNKSGPCPIDFDDCGYGLYIYDLAVTLYSSNEIFQNAGIKQAKALTNSLIEGYNKVSSLSDDDIEHIPYLVLARCLLMLAWLNDRSDNPKLAQALKQREKVIISVCRSFLNNGSLPYKKYLLTYS